MKNYQFVFVLLPFLLLFSCKKDEEIVEIVPDPGTIPFIMTISTWWDNANVYFHINDRDYSYDYTIDWGDDTKETNLTAGTSHKYLKKGTYKISITGDFPNLQIPTTQWDDKEYDVLEINQWGNIEWKDFSGAFQASPELIYRATDSPNLKNVTSTRAMFQNATSFNGDINDWDVGNVTDMRAMFQNATSFNRDLNNWDVRKVTLMNDMFKGAIEFNGNIADWDLRNLKQMTNMFAGAKTFNSDLSRWNVGNVLITARMFEGATSFNQDISNWDMRKIAITKGMFEGATSFNQDIGDWDTRNFQQVQYMFSGALQFNADIGNWNMHVAGDMRNMFDGATSFNQDLGNWNLMSAYHMENMFDNSSLSTVNYDATLKGWSEQDKLKPDVTLGAEGLRYCDVGEAARQILINKGWIIDGDARSDSCN